MDFVQVSKDPLAYMYKQREGGRYIHVHRSHKGRRKQSPKVDYGDVYCEFFHGDEQRVTHPPSGMSTPTGVPNPKEGRALSKSSWTGHASIALFHNQGE